MQQRRPYKRFGQKKQTLTTEQIVEQFILRNSDNGYFTKISTIHNKFNITEERTWEVIGDLLTYGEIESTHDGFSGEMKLCRTGRTYSILNSTQKRKRQPKAKSDYKNQKILEMAVLLCRQAAGPDQNEAVQNMWNAAWRCA